MKQLLAVALSIILPTVALAGDKPVSYKIIYDGGSVQTLKPGTDLKMYIEPTQVRFVKDKKDVITIPASAITEISYGQDVHRRIGTAVGLAVISFGIGLLVALSKSKKHFVGLTWAETPSPEAPKADALRSDAATADVPKGDVAVTDPAKPDATKVVFRADVSKKGGIAMQCDKTEYRGILAGIEGITGKKAVDSTTMTVKN
jgi:hypothetical protein